MSQPEVAVASRLALAGAFAFSAGTKLARPSAFSEGLAVFGIPAARVVARVLPPVEAAVAVLLLLFFDAVWPAVSAIVLLVVFTAAVAVNLVRGREVPCPCFSPTSAGGRPLSMATLARNVALLVMAAVAVGPTGDADPVAAAGLSVVAVAVTLAGLRRFG
ncbi:MAG: MauE/DoxX family redox-associated membrane protein [Acidimicrobiia bacterium]